MANLDIRSIAAECLGKAAPLSLKQDIFGVYSNDNPQNRSLKNQMDLIQNKSFVRVAVVTIRPVPSTTGPYANVQLDLDTANEIYQRECDAWVYCVGSIVERTNLLGANVLLDQNDCFMNGHDVSDEEDDLFDLGRDMGADVVCYYLQTGATNGLAGCAAHPPGRRGFWVMFNTSENVFAHELTHVIGRNRHPEQDPDIPDNDSDNLMWRIPGAIDNPPELRDVQCNRILDDSDMKTCK